MKFKPVFDNGVWWLTDEDGQKVNYMTYDELAYLNDFCLQELLNYEHEQRAERLQCEADNAFDHAKDDWMREKENDR